MSIFESKVAVITGGANWIGRFIAEEFRKKGASICVIDKAEGNHFVGDISDKAMLETLSTNVPTRNFSMRCPSVWQHRFTCLFEIFIRNRKTLINLIKKLIYLVDTILLCHHTNPNIYILWICFADAWRNQSYIIWLLERYVIWPTAQFPIYLLLRRILNPLKRLNQ